MFHIIYRKSVKVSIGVERKNWKAVKKLVDTARYERYESARKAKGMTDYQVASHTGIAPSILSDWKNNRSEPKAEKMVKIAQCLDITAEYLILGEG